MMNKPLLYIKNSNQRIRDFKFVYKKYLTGLKLKNNCDVLDVGCGPGDTTYNRLFSLLLSKNVKSLVGVDVSSKLIDFAQKHYQRDRRVSFRQLDIATDTIPYQFLESFDYIFSFYCLHFVKEQKKALKNIYDMLKPGGNMFLSFLGKWFAVEIYKILAHKDVWKPYLGNYQRIIGTSYTEKYPEQYFDGTLKELGFKSCLCNRTEQNWIYTKQMFIDLMIAIDTFGIPAHLQQTFALHTIEAAKSYGLVHRNASDEECVKYPYSLLVVQATKPIVNNRK